jgi:hypothetical protein
MEREHCWRVYGRASPQNYNYTDWVRLWEFRLWFYLWFRLKCWCIKLISNFCTNWNLNLRIKQKYTGFLNETSWKLNWSLSEEQDGRTDGRKLQNMYMMGCTTLNYMICADSERITFDYFVVLILNSRDHLKKIVL